MLSTPKIVNSFAEVSDQWEQAKSKRAAARIDRRSGRPMLSWRWIACTGAVLGLAMALASVLVLRGNNPLPPPPPEVQQQAEEATPPAIESRPADRTGRRAGRENVATQRSFS